MIPQDAAFSLDGDEPNGDCCCLIRYLREDWSDSVNVREKPGPYYYWISRGVDERPVRANRARKSVGAENTFSADLFTFATAWEALQPLLKKLWDHCDSAGARGRTVTLKVKYADFQQITRSRTLETPIHTRAGLDEVSRSLLEPVFPISRGIRLLGLTLSTLANEEGSNSDPQLRLGLEMGGAVHEGN